MICADWHSITHNLTARVDVGHLVRCILFNLEMEKGFKFPQNLNNYKLSQKL